MRATAYTRGDLKLAGEYFRQLAAAAQEQNYTLGLIIAYMNLDVINALLGEEGDRGMDHRETVQRLEGSVSLEVNKMISSYQQIGADLRSVGLEVEAAQEFHAYALDLAEKLEFQWGIGASMLDQGVVSHLRGDDVEAETRFREAMNAFGEADPLSRAMALQNLSILYAGQQREAEASGLKDQVREIVEELGK